MNEMKNVCEEMEDNYKEILESMSSKLNLNDLKMFDEVEFNIVKNTLSFMDNYMKLMKLWSDSLIRIEQQNELLLKRLELSNYDPDKRL